MSEESDAPTAETYEQACERLVKEGTTYADTNAALKEAFGKGIHGKIFSDLREKHHPGEKMQGALTNRKTKKEEVKRAKEEKEKKAKRAKWNATDQSNAEKSKVANALNRGLFYLVPCPTGKLTLEKVQEINLGGAFVAMLKYFLPDFNINHPVVIFIMKLLEFAIAVKTLCFKAKEKITDILTPGEE